MKAGVSNAGLGAVDAVRVERHDPRRKGLWARKAGSGGTDGRQERRGTGGEVRGECGFG